MHRLADLDRHSGAAVCSRCGPVQAQSKSNGVGRARVWRCPNAIRENRKVRGGLGQRRRQIVLKPEGDGVCERCGFVAQHPAQLDRHHRDRDSANDDPANVEVICANCHRLEHAGERVAPRPTPDRLRLFSP